MNFDIPIEQDEPKKSSRRSGIMLCYPYEVKRLATWKPPYIIQPKLDGVRCRAVKKDGIITLISSEGHTISQVPHINEALSKIDMPEVELDGELYKHGMHFQDIIKRTSRSVNKHTDSEKIEFHCFDQVTNLNQQDRLWNLTSLLQCVSSDCIKRVPYYFVKDEKEVMEFYSRVLDYGYEGFIIRDANAFYQRKRFTGIMKFKPHQSDEYLIIDTVEEVSQAGNPKGTLGAFVCTSTEGTVFNVGTGLTADQRIAYWNNRYELVGKKLKVKFQALTSGKKVPRFPVALEVIK